MSRIIICGLNGSGKTTLGKKLAQKINYIHKDVEEKCKKIIIDGRREIEEKIEIINSALK